MIKNGLIKIICFYQKYLSPLKVRWKCIYTPTCSSYAIEALQKYGAIKGSYLAVKRILRCHPFAKGGYDPVKIQPTNILHPHLKQNSLSIQGYI